MKISLKNIILSSVVASALAYPINSLGDKPWWLNKDLSTCLELTKSYEKNLWMKKIGENKVVVNACLFNDLQIKTKNKADLRFYLIIADMESDFNPNVTGKSGEIGLMQLMPGTAKQVGINNPYNPSENITGAILYGNSIDRDIRKYCGTIKNNHLYYKIKVGSYNAGTNWMKKKDRNGKTCNLNFLPETTKWNYIPEFFRLEKKYSYHRG